MRDSTRSRAIVAIVVLLAACADVRAQDPPASPLKFTGLYPGGLRTSVSDRWGELAFTVTNPGPTPRDARLVVSYAGDKSTSFGRDVWVPAQSSVSAWVSVGPAPKTGPALSRTLEMVLYDRTNGTAVVVRPATEERTRDRVVLYRGKEYITAVFVDPPTVEDKTSFRQPTVEEEVMALTRVVRSLRSQSEYLAMVPELRLPTTPEAYDSLDQIILASPRLAGDALSRAAIRRWVEQGGHLWVLLDLVDPEGIASIVGEEFAPHVVDRTSLTTLRFARSRVEDPRLTADGKNGLRTFERPVPFVRVAPTGQETIHQYIDGWPAAFTYRLGRGKILFTTVGAAAWYRERQPGGQVGGRMPATRGDPPSPFSDHPNLPVGLDHLLELTVEMKSVDHPFSPTDLQAALTDEIGYQVPGRGMVAAVLGGFVVVLVALAVVIRRVRRTEVVGWLAPAAALVAGGLLAAVGSSSRESIPPTAAVVEVAEAIPATGEVARRGLFATYSPSSGPVTLAAPLGARLDFDFTGLDGQNRTRVQTDTEAWRYENLSMPAGVRHGTFRTTTAGATSAVASFGPEGLTGTLTTATYRDPVDLVLAARNREPTAVRIAADGTFTIAAADVLPSGQFLSGVVLSDRQQRRQTIYRKLLSPTLPDHLTDRDHLFAWATPTDLPFTIGEGARSIGSSLVIVPVEYVPPPPGTTVRVPSSFLAYRRLLEGKLVNMPMESSYAADFRLRFQVPPSVVPLAIEKAIVTVKLKAASRKVTLGGYVGDTFAMLQTADGPVEPLRLEVTDPKLLQLDETGGWHVGVVIGDQPKVAGKLGEPWTIEAVNLELVGKTTERK